MAHVDWYIEGKCFSNCNCDYGCPCQFESLPTHGNCTGHEVIQIDKGHFGDVDLSGLHIALIYEWPGPVFEGNGTMQVIIDERASDAQRDALRRVMHGEETEEAATHWWVYHKMCSKVLDPLYKPFNFDVDIDRRTAKVSIPGVLEASGRPIRPPHGDGEHRVRIDLPGGIEFTLAEIGSGSTKATGAIGLDLQDTYGQWNIIRHGPAGPSGMT